MKRVTVLIIVAANFLCLSQAADKKTKGSKDLPAPVAPVSPTQQLAHAAGAPVDGKIYVIGAEDILQIRVWHEPELSGTFNVRPDGKISLPLVNEIQAAGMTPENLSAKIALALEKFMTHPEVSIAIQQVNSKKFFIMGEVARTGVFPLLIPTTILEALVNAGGFKEFAKTNDIIVIRGQQRFHFNYKEVVKGKKREQNILLEPGDQIIVR